MSDVANREAAPTWRVLQVREIRAADPGEAVGITQEELHTASRVDTGEVGHTAGGSFVGILEHERNLSNATVNDSLREAATLLVAASEEEGDDGTGGVWTRNLVAKAIRMATISLETMEEARS